MQEVIYIHGTCTTSFADSARHPPPAERIIPQPSVDYAAST